MIKIITLVFIFFSYSSIAEESPKTFFYGNHFLTNTEQPDRQAESWAICSASYDLSSQIYEEGSSSGKFLSEMANGAQIAIMMSHILSLKSENITTEQFSTNFQYAKMLMTELPSTKMTQILTKFEVANEIEKKNLLEQLANTAKVCSDNAKHQQTYIDAYREMIRSGLLALPEN